MPGTVASSELLRSILAEITAANKKPWKSLVFANLSLFYEVNVGLHTNMTLITYCIVSKKYTLNTYFLFNLKNIPFFLIFAVFDTLNTGRAALASPWKTTLFPCFCTRAWYPPLNTSAPPGVNQDTSSHTPTHLHSHVTIHIHMIHLSNYHHSVFRCLKKNNIYKETDLKCQRTCVWCISIRLRG